MQDCKRAKCICACVYILISFFFKKRKWCSDWAILTVYLCWLFSCIFLQTLWSTQIYITGLELLAKWIAMEQNKASSVVVKPRRRRLSTAHARRRARAYTNPIKQEILHEESADELGGSQEYSLENGSAAFLKGFLSETEGLVRGISDRYETQREVRKKPDFCRNCNIYSN